MIGVCRRWDAARCDPAIAAGSVCVLVDILTPKSYRLTPGYSPLARRTMIVWYIALTSARGGGAAGRPRGMAGSAAAPHPTLDTTARTARGHS